MVDVRQDVQGKGSLVVGVSSALPSLPSVVEPDPSFHRISPG